MLRFLKPQNKTLSASRDTCTTDKRGGKQSKQTKPLGRRYRVFIFCYENRNQLFLFGSFFFYQMAIMDCLLSGSIIRPYDQRALLSGTWRLQNEQQQTFFFFKASWTPGANLFFFFYLPSSCSLKSDRESGVIAPLVKPFYLFFYQTSTRFFCFRGRKKRIMSFKLFHLPTASHLGWDLTWVQSQMWLPIS